MSNNELPNLSAWHRVPAGAVIPKGTPYAYTYNGGITVDLHGCPRDTTMGQGASPHYTERPITLPLPDEEGATIMVSGDELPPRVLLTRGGGRWVTRYGAEWSAEIRAWAPVTIGETVVIR